MYKFSKNRQIELTDFNQPFGMKLNSENRWVKKADMMSNHIYQTIYSENIITYLFLILLIYWVIL